MTTLATYIIEVNWSGDNVTFVDERQQVISWNITRGRNDELSQVQAGACNILLRNDDGRYTPENSSSPLFGNLEVYKKIRIKATTTLTPSGAFIFVGFITRIQPRPLKRQCLFECKDMFVQLQNFHLNLGLVADTLSSANVTRILNAVGVAAGDQNVLTGQSSFALPSWLNSDALTALLDCADNELGGLFFINQAGQATFQDRHYRSKQTSALTLNKTADVDYDRRDGQVFRKAVLQGAFFAPGPAGSQIWSLVPLPTSIAAQTDLQLEINYGTISQSVVTPVATTDYQATVNQDGTGGDITSSLSTTSFTDYSGGASWTIHNGFNGPAYLQKCQIRGTPLQSKSDLKTVTRTASGGAGPFAKAYTHSFGLMSDTNVLGGFADYIVARFQNSRPVISVALQPHTDAIQDAILFSDISRRVTIVDTGEAWRTQVNGDFVIERLEQHWDRPAAHITGKWTLTDWGLEQFWILESGTYGQL